ncbi:MAG: DUF3078 domain-containing protein [Catalinimonas sp.]
MTRYTTIFRLFLTSYRWAGWSLLWFAGLGGGLHAQPTLPADTLWLPEQVAPVDTAQYDWTRYAPYLVTPTDTFKLWHARGAFDLNFQQVSLTNWAGGGLSSISIQGQTRLSALLDDGLSQWENRLETEYGVVRQEGIDELRKTDDNLQFTSRYSYELRDPWRLSAGVDFRTQFQPGYRYNRDNERTDTISRFLAPAFLSMTLGLEAAEQDFYSARISPLTGKVTIVTDSTLADRYEVEPDRNSRWEIGTQVDGSLRRKLGKNILFRTQATFFSGYQTFGNVDVNWETLLELRVNKYISSKLTTQLIYDDDLDVPRGPDRDPGPATQFRQALLIGFSARI